MILSTCALLGPLLPLAGALDVPRESPPAPAVSFEGLWETNYGRMRLQVDGDRVQGAYTSDPKGRVEGEIEDGTLRFRYTETRGAGDGRFELASDGASFEGSWRADGASDWTPWTGERVEARPGVRWLVILEARWESGLHEPEYTFGEMLRSYFTMAPDVVVRERKFHDEADFRRFAREVAFIAEPVVVLVSTHGTPAGISVGGTSIGPDVIAESLHAAGNIELLHLAGCDMLRGDAAERIWGGIPVGARFPISGYKTTVDWASSALSDFTYLTFVLMRGYAPEKAVRQTHAASPYTAEDDVEGCAFRPLGLALLRADGERAKE
ncbi:MAG: hypothetical protein AAF726_03940 [Planctomycetota bacterium]